MEVESVIFSIFLYLQVRKISEILARKT